MCGTVLMLLCNISCFFHVFNQFTDLGSNILFWVLLKVVINQRGKGYLFPGFGAIFLVFLIFMDNFWCSEAIFCVG